jgi:hypothetical protein
VVALVVEVDHHYMAVERDVLIIQFILRVVLII